MLFALTSPYMRRISAIIIMALTLVAITLQATIPAGYMPNLQSNGVFEMVICTANGQKTILVDKNLQPLTETTDHSVPSHESDKSSLCDFAVNTHYLASSDMPVTSGLLALFGIIDLPSSIPTSVYTVFYGNSGSRAPPVSYVI